jgi:peroxiredoxin
VSLAEKLDALRAQAESSTPPGARAAQEAAFTWLKTAASQTPRVEVGDLAPEFDLSDGTGRAQSLTQLRQRGPVIVSFFRGGWCPFCSLELKAYQDVLGTIEGLGASMVALSPDSPEHLRELSATTPLTYPLLSDRDNAVARRYGLVFEVPVALQSVYEAFGLDLKARHGSEVAELPMPATYLVGTDGKILRAFIDPDHTQRGEPTHFLDGLQGQRESA